MHSKKAFHLFEKRERERDRLHSSSRQVIITCLEYRGYKTFSGTSCKIDKRWEGKGRTQDSFTQFLLKAIIYFWCMFKEVIYFTGNKIITDCRSCLLLMNLLSPSREHELITWLISFRILLIEARVSLGCKFNMTNAILMYQKQDYELYEFGHRYFLSLKSCL